MKKTLMIGLCMMLLVLSLVAASDYYLNDTNNGGNTSSTTCTSANPCASLSQLPSLTYGDNVYLARGSIFRGAYYSGRDDVDYSSYGDSSRPKPKWYGSVNLSSTSNWTSLGGNLWRSPSSLQSFASSIALQLNLSFYNTSGTPTMMKQNSSLANNWDFYYNSTNKSITVYLSLGNPATYGNGIELPVYYRNTTGYPLIQFSSDDNISISDIEVGYTIQDGIYFYDCTNMVINGVDMKYTYQKAISYATGDNNTIKNTTCTYCGIRGQDPPYGLGGQGENFWIQQENNFYVHNNTLINGGGVIINTWHNGNGTISNNLIMNCNQSYNEWAAGIYVDGGDNTKIFNNTIINCNGGINIGTEIVGYYSDNNSITYNQIYRTKIFSILVGASGIGNYSVASNTNISHNTVYDDTYDSGSGYGNEILVREFDTLTFKDNIISTYYSTDTGNLLYWYNQSPHTRGFTSDNNLWYSSIGRYYYNVQTTTYTSLASYRLGKNQDLNSVSGEPQYTDSANYNLRPIASSPACGVASDGGDIGALSCPESTASPIVHIINSPNGTTTNDNTPTITFNFTDSDSTTSNCTLRFINPYTNGTSYFQDIANESAIYGNWTYASRLNDSNWSTKGYDTPSASYDTSSFYENYTKLPGSIVNSTIEVAFDNAGYYHASYPLNRDWLPFLECWYNTSSKIQLATFSTSNEYGEGSIQFNCNADDGGSYNYYSVSPETSLYETGINWIFPSYLAQNTSVLNNTNTNLTSSILVNGDYQLYVQCIDESGNTVNSSLMSFLVDSDAPVINIINPTDGMNTSSNSMNISYELLHETIENPLSYFNISLYDNLGLFNKTIQGNNSINTSYLWNGLLDGYSPGTYYIKVTAISTSGTPIAYSYSLFNIVTNAILNITAFGNNVSLSNFTITMTPGNTTSTTSGSVIVGIFKNYTYNVSITNSGYASSGVSMNWSNNTNNLIFYLSALANSVYIVFKDYNNLSVLSGINISLDYIGDFMSGNKSTSNGYMNLTGLTVDDYILRYDATSYETRFYSVSITDESTQNITLYMIPSSTSNNVTITVIDQNANPVMGAVVKALKYDLSSNSYLLQEIASTDIQGRVIMSLSMYDEYYKFMVEYGGVLKVTTSPAYITSNSLTIQILIGELVGQEYYHYANIFADLSFNTATNNFRLDYDDTDGIVEQVCLKVYTLGLMGEVPFNDSCSSSASGTLLVPVDYINGTTYLAKAYYYEDGNENFLTSKTYTFLGSEAFGKTYGLLLQIILTVFCAFIAVWSIPLAAILTPLSLVIGRMIHLNFFGWDAISAVFIIGLIIAYMTRKDA